MTRAPLRPEWLGALIPLGLGDQRTWRPLGVGTLLLERDVLWLAAPTSVLAQAHDRRLLCWPTPGVALELSELPDAGLRWLPDPVYDVSIRPFPADPAWGLRAFKPAQCAATTTLSAGQACLSAGFPYALTGGDAIPGPAVLEGVLSSIDDENQALISSAPILPNCPGSPLVVNTPDTQALAGLLVKQLWLEREGVDLPPLGLTVGLSSSALVGLVRSPAATELANQASAALGA